MEVIDWIWYLVVAQGFGSVGWMAWCFIPILKGR